jgi:hypothetical protein
MATGFQVKTHGCCAAEAVRRLKMTFSWRSGSAKYSPMVVGVHSANAVAFIFLDFS